MNRPRQPGKGMDRQQMGEEDRTTKAGGKSSWCGARSKEKRKVGGVGRRSRWGSRGRTDRLRASRKAKDGQTDGRDKRVPWVACILLCLPAN